MTSFPGGADYDSDEFSVLCKAAQLPASNIASIDVPFRGRIFKVAGDRTFDTWTVTVINDNDFKIRTAMEAWMQFVGQYADGSGATDPGSYQVDAEVLQFARSATALSAKDGQGLENAKQYKFYGIFPTNISAIDECEFLGSVNTLIAPSKLRTLIYDNPIQRSAGLDVYKPPEEDHDYVMTVDVARGVGEDYSAFVVVDITEFPHQIVSKYRNNDIKPMLFPNIIYEIAKNYNSAYILCEVNDIGDQVASILQYDLEYQNLLMCSMRGRAGQIVGQGFSGKKTQLGVKMSKTVKKVGSLNLKTLIEEDKLIFNDYEIISELTTFISKHNSFEAEEGCNDDLAMCLVIYAWLVQMDYFKELTDQDVRKRLYEEQKNQIEQDMAPFGFLNDGLDDDTFTDSEGDTWRRVDEYGDRSFMWEYR